ncbi:MAG: hypothetical protein LBR32_09380 [Propionibacteriaceae bacterium]|jgi:hypothetical protein|nr:hypothetical protein [Propionibacteriaceae bacterium]
MTAASVFLGWMGFSDDFHTSPWVALPVAVVGVAFCGSATLCISRRIPPGNGLILDERGLTDRTISVSATGFTPWSQVARVEAARRAGQAFVRVIVADPDALAARMSPLGRWFARLNRFERTGDSIWIATDPLGVDARMLAALLRHYRRAAVGNRHS